MIANGYSMKSLLSMLFLILSLFLGLSVTGADYILLSSPYPCWPKILSSSSGTSDAASAFSLSSEALRKRSRFKKRMLPVVYMPLVELLLFTSRKEPPPPLTNSDEESPGRFDPKFWSATLFKVRRVSGLVTEPELT